VVFDSVAPASLPARRQAISVAGFALWWPIFNRLLKKSDECHSERSEESAFPSGGIWMRTFSCLALLLFTFSLNAQAPVAVPIPKEPHHHFVFENEYVRVFRVTVPAHEATLLHQHDVPYVYVSLGPADVINAVQGKPEAHLVMADGQVGYSRGGFAHVARVDSDMPFNNVTIELLKPQGEPENTCAEVVPGPSKYHCDSPSTQKGRTLSTVSQFRTEETEVNLTRVNPESDRTNLTVTAGTLLVLLSGAGIQKELKGVPQETLAVGDVMWLPAGSNTTFSNPSRKAWSYLTLGFSGTEALHKY
jgi:hypothetical protein